MKMKKLFILVILSNFLVAQNDSLQIVKLDEIEIKSIKSSSILESVPLSISKIKVPRLWSKQQLSLQEYINSIPGVVTFNANNFAQDLRISIRGFGARSAFGIRGIKIIIDGIPETTPDGQGQLDNLPLQLIENIEVIRGSSSLRYGNAAGDTLFLEDQLIHKDDFINENDSLFGKKIVEEVGDSRKVRVFNIVIQFLKRVIRFFKSTNAWFSLFYFFC